MRTRVKICGITRPDDGALAAALGADAIGLVFYPSSPRAVDIGMARAICMALPPFVTVVGLFVDAAVQSVEAVLRQVPVDLIQFHGSENAGECGRYGVPYIKVVRMADGVDPVAVAAAFPDARGFLLDAGHPDLPGGSGRTFDWSLVPGGLGRPVILAGGLTPDNVGAAVRRLHPYGVDVSSGVERSRGVKDKDRIEAFIRGVQSVDAES